MTDPGGSNTPSMADLVRLLTEVSGKVNELVQTTTGLAQTTTGLQAQNDEIRAQLAARPPSEPEPEVRVGAPGATEPPNPTLAAGGSTGAANPASGLPIPTAAAREPGSALVAATERPGAEIAVVATTAAPVTTAAAPAVSLEPNRKPKTDSRSGVKMPIPQFKKNGDAEDFMFSASRWLKRHLDCDVVTLLTTAFQDHPDALKWLQDSLEQNDALETAPWDPIWKKLFSERFAPQVQSKEREALRTMLRGAVDHKGAEFTTLNDLIAYADGIEKRLHLTTNPGKVQLTYTYADRTPRNKRRTQDGFVAGKKRQKTAAAAAPASAQPRNRVVNEGAGTSAYSPRYAEATELRIDSP